MSFGPGYIYAVEAVGLDRVKIGFTRNLQSRARVLVSGSPVPLRWLGAVKVDDASEETKIHSLLNAHRLHNEWFDYRSAIVKSVVNSIIEPAPLALPDPSCRCKCCQIRSAIAARALFEADGSAA